MIMMNFDRFVHEISVSDLLGCPIEGQCIVGWNVAEPCERSDATTWFRPTAHQGSGIWGKFIFPVRLVPVYRATEKVQKKIGWVVLGR